MSNAANENNPSGKTSRLVGWLVSYQMDEMGKAFEIRAGRTLISSENGGKARTITLEASGVSSPHLALSASQKHTIMVQDIFSDQGSFLKKASSDDEKRISGPIQLEHGDWVRIGEKSRFQLCLIEGSARK